MNVPDLGVPLGSVGIANVRHASSEPFAAVVGEGAIVAVHDVLGESTPLSFGDLISDWPRWWSAIWGRLDGGRLPASAIASALDAADLEVLAPADRPQIFQAGANYRTHVIQLMVAQRTGAQEGDTDDDIAARAAAMMDERKRTGSPYVFIGLHGAIVGAFDDVVLPAGGEQPDWELELAAVIGRGGQNISVDDALAHVAGYTIVNDLTLRELVYRPDIPVVATDWMRSKNAPTFLPVGPVMVPVEYVGDPAKLQIQLRLNGELKQDGETSDMLFDTAELIAYASTRARLLPGDLVLTGSPAGNGSHFGRFLQPGDVIESEITGLGRQRNRCAAEESAA